MKTYYSCVVDVNPKFHYQSWLLVHSLIEMANVSPQNIWIHYIVGVDVTFLEKLRSLGVQLKEIDSFGDGKYCNKIAQLSNESLKEADLVILMDTDMIVTQQISGEINFNCVSGKIVDYPNPEISVLNKIFSEAGIEEQLAPIKTDFSEDLTYAGNYNGGLYVIPKIYLGEIYTSWKKWALWLLETRFLHDVDKGIHVDQVSFCMTVHEKKIPIEHLHKKYNFPTHIDYFKDIEPAIIHYHWELDATGLLKTDLNSTKEYRESIRKVNALIQRHFDNEIFWNYRYSVHPELGSGVGSRGNNLDTKRDYLRRLKIEDHSVLDIGFGDLELMKEFNIKSYVGIDSSDEAITLARNIRDDWKFIRAGSISNNEIPYQDYVTCFDVLIHQKNSKDFNDLISLMVNKTKKRLLVSGYTSKEKHHDTNHMLSFHQSLSKTLNNSKKFNSVIKLFRINDTDYYSCDVHFDKEFWKTFFYNLIIDKMPDLKGKRIYLHIGTPKSGTSSLQKYLYDNREELYEQRILYPEYTSNYKHQSLVSAMLNNDWMSFMHFFEKIQENLSNTDTIIISSEGFYNYTSEFSEVGKLFWMAIREIVDLKVVVYLRKQAEFLESFYRQCIINPKTKDNLYGSELDINNFAKLDRVIGNLDYESTLNTWCDIVGEHNLILRPYQENISLDFLEVLKINNIGLKDIQRQNQSLPPIAIELIRRCNGFLDENSQQLLVNEVKGLYLSNKANNDPFVNSEMKEIIKTKYAEGNKRLAIKWPSISNSLIDINGNKRVEKKFNSERSLPLLKKKFSYKKWINKMYDYYIIRTSGLFDNQYYLHKNPDVKESGTNPIIHYIRHGVIENRDPSKVFDTNYYKRKNKDVVDAGLNPFVHYIRFGKYEGRSPNNDVIDTDLITNQAMGSSKAPNDMSSDDFERALNDVEYPKEFIDVVKASRETFGWYTKHYPRIHEYPWLLNKLSGDISGKKIADFGAGLSPMPIIFAEYGAIVTTIDNHTLIREANDLVKANEWGFLNYAKINSNITSLNLSMNEYTFSNDNFDVWYSISVIEHLPADVRRQILTLMQESLKNNGRLLLTIDLVKGTNKLWNYSEGKEIEEAQLHGNFSDIQKELTQLGFLITETQIIRLPDSERVDLGIIDAILSN
jgi:2-polyprenyl-3-methyl-5-hydroxy-6-metoxy-1,4-benzoquinol methylase